MKHDWRNSNWDNIGGGYVQESFTCSQCLTRKVQRTNEKQKKKPIVWFETLSGKFLGNSFSDNCEPVASRPMFRVSGYWIEQVQVLRETENCYFIKCGTTERRQSKRTNDGGIYESFESAKAELIKQRSKMLAEAEKQVSYLKQRVEAAKNYTIEKVNISL